MPDSNINDSFFDGAYKEIWRTIIPGELTVKEVDFMLPYFKLEAGSKVLDLMCGYGRHALALGRKGIAVIAVDNLGYYIKEIQQTAINENLPVNAVQAPVLEYKTGETVDLALCMGNSLQFFNATDATTLLVNIASQLKAGGHLLINSWSIAEIAMKEPRKKTWSQVDGFKFLSDSKFHFHPTRIETDSIIISPDGSTEEKKAIDYIFSLNEMEAMLATAGFALKEVYSIPGRKKFTVGEPRAYLVAEKK
jgi:SAM-dependent methyltransferase